ncbi:MAG: hypothetical protein HOE90_08180 [Bacteriovoracaceae bacterium]|jgi:hypothetical protein|nr:hypothetical protein [Bacteriovoracaceae bacterium]
MNNLRELNKNETFPYLKNTNEMLECFPKDLKIFDVAKLKLSYAHPEAITNFHDIKLDFDNSLSVIFNLYGEISGHACAQVPDHLVSEDSINREIFNSLFTEANNIVIGHFLSNLDENVMLLSQMNSPMLFESSQRESEGEKSKKVRILKLLEKTIQHHEVFRIGYDLVYENKLIPFHILLIINFKMPKND